MKKICTSCSLEMPPQKSRCPHCHAWVLDKGPNGFATAMGEAEKVPEASAGSAVLLSEVRSSNHDRIRGGLCNLWPDFASGFGATAGIVRTGVSLVAGHPGAGKSTSLLQLSSDVLTFLEDQGESGEVFYVATEEGDGEIKARYERLSLPERHLSKIRLVYGLEWEEVFRVMTTYPVRFMILDSLHGMTGGSDDEMIKLCVALKRFAVKNRCPIVIVSHVNKGEDFAGRMTLQHAVDTLAITSIDEESGAHLWEVDKNRHGKGHVTAVTRQNDERGRIEIVEMSEEEEESVDD